MFCANCGTQLGENVKFCTSCGALVTEDEPVFTAEPQYGQSVVQQGVSQQDYAQAPQQPQVTVNVQQATYTPGEILYPRNTNGGLLQAAFIINLIVTICFGWTLLPLAWMIPMTVHSYGIYKGKKPNTVAFGVCTLLFVGLVGGILMLVADKDE